MFSYTIFLAAGALAGRPPITTDPHTHPRNHPPFFFRAAPRDIFLSLYCGASEIVWATEGKHSFPALQATRPAAEPAQKGELLVFASE